MNEVTIGSFAGFMSPTRMMYFLVVHDITASGLATCYDPFKNVHVGLPVKDLWLLPQAVLETCVHHNELGLVKIADLLTNAKDELLFDASQIEIS